MSCACLSEAFRTLARLQGCQHLLNRIRATGDPAFADVFHAFGQLCVDNPALLGRVFVIGRRRLAE
jgi:hypothetical protein